MSIGAFCVSESVGGGELYLIHLLSALRDRGWPTQIWVSSPRVEDAAKSFGLRAIRVQMGPKLGRRSAFRTALSFSKQRATMLKALRADPVDVLYLQYKLETLLLGSDRVAPIQVVLEHGEVPREILLLPIVHRRFVEAIMSADLKFAASVPASQSLKAAGVSSTSLNGGVEVDGMSIDPPGARRGLFAGRLEPKKGVMEAINLTLRSPGHALTIAGSGSLERSVQAAATQFPEKIRFLGYRTDIDNLIQQADYGLLLVPAGAAEGRPLFVLECAARGRPVVAEVGNSALEALAVELGPGYVNFVNSAVGEIDDVLIHRVVPKWRTWAEVAEEFAKEVGRVQRKPLEQ